MPNLAPKLRQEIQEIPLKIVGGNHFGRYPKISQEQTWNMIISDGALVDYAGYADVLTQSTTAIGRGEYSSSRGNLILAVWGAQAYKILQSGTPTNIILTATFVGNLQSSQGAVFLAENNNYEIAFTDGIRIYVYNYNTNTFKVSGTDFNLPAALTAPGYISFQNTRFIVVNNGTSNWYLSAQNNGISWPTTSDSVGALQSKPDTVQAAVPTPGGGNNLYLFGHNVVEQWQDVGNALFPYQRSSTFNVDYGTVNPESIAALDNYVVFLSGNEQSGVTLMVISGNQGKSISTDGIDYKLANLTDPNNCVGFLIRQDGHLLYQFTFPTDNLSYVYDVNTGEFFNVSDENLNYHIARTVVFFNNNYYFVSLRGGNLYRFGTQYTNISYGDGILHEIPRIRVCPPIRLPSQRMFIAKSLGFTIENGQPNTITTSSSVASDGFDLATEDLVDIVTEDGNFLVTEDFNANSHTYVLASESVDLSISRDGGESFGNSYRLDMNPIGKRRSRFIYQRLGQLNDGMPQLRFNGFGRFVVFDGIVEAYE